MQTNPAVEQHDNVKQLSIVDHIVDRGRTLMSEASIVNDVFVFYSRLLLLSCIGMHTCTTCYVTANMNMLHRSVVSTANIKHR